MECCFSVVLAITLYRCDNLLFQSFEGHTVTYSVGKLFIPLGNRLDLYRRDLEREEDKKGGSNNNKFKVRLHARYRVELRLYHS